MYFIINETLEECDKNELKNHENQYVACLTSSEWKQEQDSFDIGIEFEPDLSDIFVTQAELNYDAITGTFCIPNKKNFQNDQTFAFVLDEKGIIFIDDSGYAKTLVNTIAENKKWRFPSLERFIYDFLSQLIKDDLSLIKRYERELDQMEVTIENEDDPELNISKRVNEIRGDIRELIDHYEELADFGQVLEENENNFFKKSNTRYFRLFLDKIDNLRDASKSIRDLTIQIRDLYKTHLDIKQNHIMTVLTIVTTIFMPLTLIVGWYGMNFRFMPELESPFAYPIIIGISLLIIIGSLLYFRKKKWL